MVEKPSINDYDAKDFSCVKEYEYWRRNAIAQLEAENERLRDHISLAPVAPHQFVIDYEEWRSDGKKLRSPRR